MGGDCDCYRCIRWEVTVIVTGVYGGGDCDCYRCIQWEVTVIVTGVYSGR